MRIHTFSYRDAARDWELKEVSFDDLTLLVGVSGVGKTQILNSIRALSHVACGFPQNGVSWRVQFSTRNGDRYRWEGEYDYQSRLPLHDPSSDNKSRLIASANPMVQNENLYRNDVLVLKRKGMEMYLGDEAMPKLAPSESALKLLEEEEAIRDAAFELQRCIVKEPAPLAAGSELARISQVESLAQQLATADELRESNIDVPIKLAVAYQRFPELFDAIQQAFIEVFPNVSDVRVAPSEGETPWAMSRGAQLVQIRERDVSRWIEQPNISSGMLRTLLQLAHLHLCVRGTVILIDEFENSLGVNCIDLLTDGLLRVGDDLQFIITSHHPYIVNNVPPKYWRIVRRRGGHVYTEDASTLRLDESHHQAFIQLINTDAFTEGIAVQ